MAATLTTPNTILGVLAPKSQTSRILANVATVIVGTALLTLSAKINVPTWPIPVTLQTFAVAVLAAAFGWRVGVATVVAYLLEGAAGLPVFSTGGGIGFITGPAGGFLLGFIPMAYVVGRAADLGASSRVVMLGFAMLIADALAFVIGFAWLVMSLAALKGVAPTAVLGSAFDGAIKPFVIWDILKMALAAVTVAGGWQLIKKRA